MRDYSSQEKKDILKSRSCIDCGDLGVSYGVHSPVWKKAVPEYFELKKELRKTAQRIDGKPLDGVTVCLGCLSKRLGRKLRKEDFKDVPVNRELFTAIQAVDLEK